MEENIGDVIADRVETGELIIDGEAYPPQWPVGNVFYSRGKTGKNIVYILNCRVVKNKWNIIKYKLIIEGIEVNN